MFNFLQSQATMRLLPCLHLPYCIPCYNRVSFGLEETAPTIPGEESAEIPEGHVVNPAASVCPLCRVPVAEAEPIIRGGKGAKPSPWEKLGISPTVKALMDLREHYRGNRGLLDILSPTAKERVAKFVE